MNKQQIVSLGDVVTVVNENEYDSIKNGVTKYVAGGHIESEKFYITKFGDVNRDIEVIGSAFHKLFKKGHILYKTRYPNSGAIATFDGLCSNTTLVLKTNKDSNLIEGLLPFILKWDQFNEYLTMQSVGSTNSYVRWRDLSNFEFVLPPKNEQFKLHNLFWSIQHSIDDLENLLEKSKIYFKSKCESLITRGIGHTKFKKVKWFFGKEIEIPVEWNIINLGKISNISSGVTLGRKLTGDIMDVSYLRVANVQDGYLDLNEIKSVTILKKEFDKWLLKKGDILLTEGGDWDKLGRGTIWQDEISNCIHQNHIFKLRFDQKKYNSWYFSYLLGSPSGKRYFQIVSKKTSNLATINSNQLKSFNVFVPSLSEQNQITSILTKLNEQIDQQQSHLKNLYNLRKSVLNSKLISKEQINVTN